jgi:hypothetical protein
MFVLVVGLAMLIVERLIAARHRRSVDARVRPWLGLVTMHFGLMSLNDFLDSSVGMVTLHLFTFNPTSIHEF